jgi:hypothetical protein
VFQTADGPRGARTLAKKPRLPLRTAVGRAIASPSYRYMNKPASKYTVLGEAMRAHYAIQHGIATAEEYERRGDDPCPDCGEPEHATHTLNRCLKGWFSTKEGEQYKGADAAREYVRKFLQNVEGGEKVLTVGEADECGYCDVMPTSSRSRSHVRLEFTRTQPEWGLKPNCLDVPDERSLQVNTPNGCVTLPAREERMPDGHVPSGIWQL